MGKGSSPRPFDVAFEQYATNFDQIFRRQNVFQQETKDTNRNLETATPAQAGCEVLGDSESTAERVATSPTK